MTVVKRIGKPAKSEVDWTAVGEFIGDLMPVIGWFLAVRNYHPTWQLWTKHGDPDSESQLNTEKKMSVLGLTWESCAARRD